MTNRAIVAHLVRRLGFGATTQEIDALVPLSRGALVDRLLDLNAAAGLNAPAPPPDLGGSKRVLSTWWLDRMVTNPRPAMEKMALFWHGLWVAVPAQKNFPAWWNRLELLSRFALTTNYTDFAKRLSVDPAMLLYLDNNANTKDRPQENFGRELLELFLLGEGNYTEADVVSSARAWTGHTVDKNRRYAFVPARHDTGQKTLFGSTWNIDGPQVIDACLWGPKSDVAARYLVARLWSYLAYPIAPSDPLVATLAAAFRQERMNIRTLVRRMAMRDEFVGPAARQGLVRPPVEWVVATVKAFGLKVDEHTWSLLPGLGQDLLVPPNVAGWKQNGYWVSSAASWARLRAARTLASRLTKDSPLFAAAALPTADAVRFVFDRFGCLEVSDNSRGVAEQYLAGERAAATGPMMQMRGLAALVALSPEVLLA